MNTLLQEIAQLEGELQAVTDRNEHVRITNLLSEKREQYNKQLQQVEQEEREQSKQVVIESYVETLSQIFEALFPSEKFRPLFGINEYEEKRSQFYQLNHAYVSEKVDEMHQNNELALSLKDDRIKLLNDQSLAVQQDLAEARKKAEEAWNENDALESKVNEVNEQIRKLSAELDEAVNKFVAADLKANELQAKVDELTQKLEEAAKQPKVESKPSQKLADMMNEIKSKNEITADDYLARWNARQKTEEVKISLPEIKAPDITGSPFRREEQTNTSSDATNDKVLGAGDENVNGGQFPNFTPEVPLGVGGSSAVRESGEEKGETVTRAEFEELKCQVASLALQVGKGAVA